MTVECSKDKTSARKRKHKKSSLKVSFFYKLSKELNGSTRTYTLQLHRQSSQTHVYLWWCTTAEGKGFFLLASASLEEIMGLNVMSVGYERLRNFLI